MEYTSNYSFRKPQRGTDPDRADINDLTDNWERVDGLLKGVSDSGDATSSGLQAHITDYNNPHRTDAAQIGAATPGDIADAIIPFQQHVADTENPHFTTAAQTGAPTVDEMEAALEEKVTLGADLSPDQVMVTNGVGNAITSPISTTDLEALTGITGNIQEQLNNISFYNYLSGLPIITMNTGGDDFPGQSLIDAQVIPLIEAAYPNPTYHDAIIQNVQTQNLTQRKAILYSYFDGTQSDGFVGWRYITDIDTVINRANGEVYGVVQSSDDISFVAGVGTVEHSVLADNASSADGLTELQIGVDAGAESTDLNTYYGLEKASILWAGAGNSVANKPDGVDAFFVIPVRAAAGHTVQLLYASESGTYSGAWSREWDATSWSEWRNLLRNIEQTITPVQVTNFATNPNTWGIPGGLSSSDSFKVWGNTSASGFPAGWGSAAGSGIFSRQLADGTGALTIFRQATSPAGNSVEFAWKGWAESSSFWSNWHTIGNDIGSSSLPFINGYFTGTVQTQYVVGTDDVLYLKPSNTSDIIGTLQLDTFSSSVPVFGPDSAMFNPVDLGGSQTYWRNGNFSGTIMANTVNASIVTSSIATQTGLNLAISSSNNITFSSGTTNNVFFNGSGIFPAAARSGNFDLGSSTNLFRDAYITRNIYLGGSLLSDDAVRANTLEAYDTITLGGVTISEWPTLDGSAYLPKVGGAENAMTGDLYSRRIIPYADNLYALGTGTRRFSNGYFNSLTLGGTTITEWPSGGGSTSTLGREIIVGSTTAGHTSSDCDFLCTGTADQLVIAQAVAEAGTGGIVRLLDATYYFSAFLALGGAARINVTLRGTTREGTIITRGDGMSNSAALINAETNTIEDLTLENNISGTSSAAIGSNTTTSGITTIRRCTINSTNSCITGNVNRTLIVTDCALTSNSYGIVTFGPYTYIARNTILWANVAGSTGVSAITSTAANLNCTTIENNYMLVGQSVHSWAITGQGLNYNLVIRNNITDGAGISASGQYVTVEGNTIRNAHSQGILMSGSTNVPGRSNVVRSNRILSAATFGIYATEGIDLVLSDNTIEESGGDGIGVYNSIAAGVRIVNNVVKSVRQSALNVSTSSSSVIFPYWVITGNTFLQGAVIYPTLSASPNGIFENNILPTGPQTT